MSISFNFQLNNLFLTIINQQIALFLVFIDQKFIY